MANPGPYPPMGHMQPGGAPMGPMGPMGMQRPPVRQGTSHIVPVVVSAGLAVGVFCGLLFGLGVKKDAEPIKASNGAKQSEESQIQTAAVSMGGKTPDKPPARAGSGSDAASAGSAAAAPVPPRPGKLTLDIKPDSIAQSARITVDGKPVAGTTAEVAFDPGTKEKIVKVVVQAPGYQDEQREQQVRPEEVTSLSIQLRPTKTAATGTGVTGGDDSSGKASTGGTGGKATGGKATGGKGSASKGTGKGSGLIDI